MKFRSEKVIISLVSVNHHATRFKWAFLSDDNKQITINSLWVTQLCQAIGLGGEPKDPQFFAIFSSFLTKSQFLSFPSSCTNRPVNTLSPSPLGRCCDTGTRTDQI